MCLSDVFHSGNPNQFNDQMMLWLNTQKQLIYYVHQKRKKCEHFKQLGWTVTHKVSWEVVFTSS